MVQVTGLEPARITSLDPKSSASASSATSAFVTDNDYINTSEYKMSIFLMKKI